MKIAVILTAFDRMSSVVNQATSNAEKRMKQLMTKKFVEGGALAATGIGLMKSLQPAVQAYANLEEASADLRASMMDSNGAIDQNFQKVSVLAEGLGNKLPGTTADFYRLFKTMMENGVKSENILNGVGNAAAFLAVDLKMPYEAAGEFAARMKEATGIADDEMLKFMDTVSRLKSLGIGADEMRYAFSRSSGTLKLLGLQGLKASNDMGVLYSQMIRIGGMSGETAGTSFNNIMQSLLDKKKFKQVNDEAKRLGVTLEFFKNGQFLGIENMVAQFDKLSKFDINKRANLVQLLTGGGQDAQAVNTIISQGAAGFAKLRAEMEKKAGLNDKVNVKLKTLKSLWEATTGTIENMLAALGEGLAPVLKPLVEMIGTLAAKIKDWLSNNPALAKFISMLIAAAGIALTLAGVVKIIGAIRIAMALLNITLLANPFILIATAAVIAVSLIYANWGKIKAWFERLWSNVKEIFLRVWRFIKKIFWDYQPAVLIYKNWEKIKAWFANLWNSVIQFFVDSWNRIKSGATECWETVKNIIVAPIEWIRAKWQALLDWFTNAWKKVKGWFSDFFNWVGDKATDAWDAVTSSPVDQMVKNIERDKPKLEKAMASVAQSADNYLPHSPAKKGALSRLHKVRIVETVAEAVKPFPLVDKMKKVAGITWATLNARPVGSVSSAGAGGGGTTINFDIHLSGTATKQDAKNIMSEIEKKLPQMLKKYNSQKDRIGFS